MSSAIRRLSVGNVWSVSVRKYMDTDGQSDSVKEIVPAQESIKGSEVTRLVSLVSARTQWHLTFRVPNMLLVDECGMCKCG